MEPVTESGVFTKEDEASLLALVADWADQNGWETDWGECEELQNIVLRLGIPRLGKAESSVVAELSFLHPASANEKFVVAQIVASLFMEIPQENQGEVGKACLRTNRYTLVGSFGTRDSMLYYRHNLLLRPDFTYADCAQMLVDGLINLSQTIDATIDGFALVGRGVETVESAVEKGYLD